VELLHEIWTWSTCVGALLIYWLNGIPGTGKTTLAHTFAQTMFAEGRLGASFFCSRDYENRKDIRLIRRLDERAMVRAGPGVLEVVLQNVLENAISFSPRGGTIILTLTVNGEMAELQIDDEGPGVDPAKIPHMFERYFSSRPEDGHESAPSGHAGLGLWIVRRNVEALGGQVSAANRIGGGLSVSIELPRNGS